ncbi:MAG: regulatory protein RecX [Nitrospiraceae bacterium]
MGAGKRTGPSLSEQWLHLAVRYLARRDRTVAQVEQFLRDKGASPAQAKETIGRLSDLRYLNDRAYAERWVENRLAHRPMGRERLKAELQAKGIADTLADGAIHKGLRGVNEEALARRVLRARQRRGRRLTPVQALRLLRQRGFEEETIDHIIGARMEREEPGA